MSNEHPPVIVALAATAASILRKKQRNLHDDKKLSSNTCDALKGDAGKNACAESYSKRGSFGSFNNNNLRLDRCVWCVISWQGKVMVPFLVSPTMESYLGLSLYLTGKSKR